MTFFERAAEFEAPGFKSPMLLALAVLALMSGCERDAQGEDAPATFFFENVRAAQVLVPEDIGFNAWGFPKVKQYKMLACPKDLALMAPIVGQTFGVRDETGETKTLVTDSRGCLQWDEFYEYDHFAPETFLDVKRTFIGGGSHTGRVEVSLAVNPWANQALDVRYETPQQLELPLRPSSFKARLVDGEPAAAMIDVRSMSFQFLAVDYGKWEVDPQLKLTVAHNYRLRFEPRVIRRTLAQPRTVSETPLRGKVRVSIVIVKEGRGPDVTPDQYVTHYAETVDMQVGGVTRDVTLKFPDTISEISSRMRAFVKITPIVDSPSVGSAKLASPIGPLPSQAAMQLVPTDVDADAVIAQIGRKKDGSPTEELKPVELFEQVSGFRKLDAEAWNDRPVVAAARLDFTQAKAAFSGRMDKRAAAALSKRLCYEIYDGSLGGHRRSEGEGKEGGESAARRPNLEREAKRLLGRCLSRPEKMINVEMRDLVDQLQTPVVRRTGFVQQESLSLASGITITQSEARSNGTTTRRSIGYNLDGSLGLSFGLDRKLGSSVEPPKPGIKSAFNGKIGAGVRGGVSGERFWATSRQVETRRSTSVSANVTRAVVVEAYALDIDVVARRCLIAAPAGETLRRERGVFFCDDQVTNRTAREAYYFVNQQASGASPVHDGLSGAETPWRMSIRGSHIFNSFKRVVADTRLELVLEPMDEDEKDDGLSEKAKEVFLMSPMTQDFPGMLSPSTAGRR